MHEDVPYDSGEGGWQPDPLNTYDLLWDEEPVSHPVLLDDLASSMRRGHPGCDGQGRAARGVQRLGRERALRAMGPRRRAALVRALAERARVPDGGGPDGRGDRLLWVAHRPDLEALVDDFDTLLRRFGKGAEEAMSVADTLSASTTHSAATFDQTIEALLAASA